MDKAELFAATTRMRRDTADWLATLSEDQLDEPSLCEAWRVREVAGHLVTPLVVGLPAMALRVARSGFSLDRAMTGFARQLADRPSTELVDDLRAHAGREVSVPVVGAHGQFTDLIVHNADMRVPLGAPWRPEAAWTAEALAFVCPGALGFTDKRRLAGLRIRATDADVDTGRGAELRGPAYSLLLALCGRRIGLDDLEGPGVELLSAQLG